MPTACPAYRVRRIRLHHYSGQRPTAPLRIRTRWTRCWTRFHSRVSQLAPTERALLPHVHCRTWVRLANLGTPPSPPRKPSRRHPRALGLTTTLFFCPLTTTSLGRSVCSIQGRVEDCAVLPASHSQSLAEMALLEPSREGMSLPTGHPAERVLQYKTTWHGRHSSVAGHGIEHWRIAATLSTGQTTTAHQACPGVNTLVHLQVGELSSPFASPFRLVICSNLASLSHIPYHKPPLRIAYPVQEQDSKPKGRSSPLPLAANTLHTLHLQTCSHNGLRLV